MPFILADNAKKRFFACPLPVFTCKLFYYIAFLMNKTVVFIFFTGNFQTVFDPDVSVQN
jgi:hypothetical protein